MPLAFQLFSRRCALNTSLSEASSVSIFILVVSILTASVLICLYRNKNIFAMHIVFFLQEERDPRVAVEGILYVAAARIAQFLSCV